MQKILEYKAETDQRNKMLICEQIYSDYTNLFYKMCNKYKILGEHDDLMQECFFALITALDTYSMDAEYNFITHLVNNTAWHLMRYANRCNGQSIFLEKAYNILSLNSEMPNNEKAEEFINSIPSDEDIESKIIDNAMCKWLEVELNKELAKLTEKERQIINLKYREKRTLEEIGEIYNVTLERIRDILESCYRKMRQNKRIKEIHSYYDDAFTLAYKGNVSNFHRTSTSATEKAAFRIMELEELLRRNG